MQRESWRACKVRQLLIRTRLRCQATSRSSSAELRHEKSSLTWGSKWWSVRLKPWQSQKVSNPNQSKKQKFFTLQLRTNSYTSQQRHQGLQIYQCRHSLIPISWTDSRQERERMWTRRKWKSWLSKTIKIFQKLSGRRTKKGSDRRLLKRRRRSVNIKNSFRPRVGQIWRRNELQERQWIHRPVPIKLQ